MRGLSLFLLLVALVAGGLTAALVWLNPALGGPLVVIVTVCAVQAAVLVGDVGRR